MGSPPTTTPPGAPATPGAQDEPRRQVGIAFEAEHGLVGSRHIVFATRNLPPPAELYITSDDGLYITVTNNSIGLALNIVAQILLPDGRLSSNLYTVQPPTNSTPTAYFFLLTEGYLFNVTVQPPPIRRGRCWVTVAIRRGNLASGVTLQTLIQDYADAFSGPTWPGGTIHHSSEGTGLIQSTWYGNLPVGTTFTYTIPANVRIKMRALTVGFNTSATVATRCVYLTINDESGNAIYQDGAEVTQAASNYDTYTWASGLGFTQTAFRLGGAMTRGLPDLALSPNWQIVVNAVAMQTGDSFNAVNFSWEQWFSV